MGDAPYVSALVHRSLTLPAGGGATVARAEEARKHPTLLFIQIATFETLSLTWNEEKNCTKREYSKFYAYLEILMNFFPLHAQTHAHREMALVECELRSLVGTFTYKSHTHPYC